MRFLAAIIVALLATPPIAAEKPVAIREGQAVTGRFVVRDGDSMTLLFDSSRGMRQSKIRMDAIVALELGQPFSNQSKQTPSGMVFEKECRVESLRADKYGRTIGCVTIDGMDGNAAVLKAGIARHGTSGNTTTGREWPTGTTRG